MCESTSAVPCQTLLFLSHFYRLFCRYLIKTWDCKKSTLFSTLYCILKAYVFWPRKFLGWFLIWSNYSCITAQGNRSSFYKHTHTHTHCTMYSQRLVVLLLPRRKSRGGVLLVFFLFSAAALLFLNTRHSQNSVVFYRVWLEFVCLIHKAKLFLSNFVRLSTMNFRVRDRE